MYFNLVLLFCTHLVIVLGDKEEASTCGNCKLAKDCKAFGDMTKQEQIQWQGDHSCELPKDDADDMNILFGFAPFAKGDYICCPLTDNNFKNDDNEDVGGEETPSTDSRFGFGRTGHRRNTRPGIRITMNNPRQDQQNNRGSHNIGNTFGNNRNNGRNAQIINQPASGNFNQEISNGQNIGGNGPNIGNNYGSINQEQSGFQQPQQCKALINYPPSLNSGCCGVEATTSSRSTVTRAPQTQYGGRPSSPWAPNNNDNPNGWFPTFFSSKNKRSAENDSAVGISIDNRITGGTASAVKDFPWLVLLTTIFDYGRREEAFNCGGSLISATYVLTAGHCVTEKGARVKDVEVVLAEFNKQTYPRDCVNGEYGRECITNIKVHTNYVIPHPEYDERILQNDIALIRLRNRVEYTEFIRPICLPPIDIDSPDFKNLPVSVAGWGRNGEHTSNIKQWTIVNLVPQAECKKSYSFLTRRHVCAAGYSGEDTCKGDSGGPLMVLYEGKYFVSGVVSGKRADSPCGTSVPSLYTNVYRYLDWINSNIRN